MRGLRRDRFIATAFVIVVVCASPSLAGVNRWTSSGPEGASITAIAGDPYDSRYVYAGTEGAGVFRAIVSDDPQWEPFSAGLGDSMITALAFDDPVVYAGTAGGRLFVSAPGEAQWSEVDKPESGAIRGFAIDANRGRIFIATDSGILRSTDRGRSWRVIAELARPAGAVAVTSNGMVFAAVWSPANVVVSVDAGDSWKPTTLGFASALGAGPNSVLYASQNGAVVKSADNGMSWTSLPYLEGRASALLVSPNSLTAATERGLYQHVFGTQVWTRIGDSARVTSATPIVSSPETWLVGNHTGVFRASRSSATWSPALTGLNAAFVSDLTVDAAEIVLAATPGGLFEGTDEATWRKLPGLTQPVEHVEASGEDIYIAGSKGMGVSRDGGQTWKVLNSYRASSMAVGGTGTLYASFQEAISKSTDGGQTWRSLTSGFQPADYFFYYGYGTSTLEVDRDDSEVAYVGFGDALFKSANGGAKWVLIDNRAYPDMSVSVAGRGNTVYIGRRNGIQTSADGGLTFSSRQLIDETINTIAIDPVDSAVAYAGTASGVIYRSTDRGDSWAEFDEGLPGVPIHRLMTSLSGKRIYAATSAGAFEYEIGPSLAFDRLPDDPSRLPRLLRGIVTAPGTSLIDGEQDTAFPAFILPAVGTVHGARGIFRTDVTLANARPADQDVLLVWLPHGNPAGPDVPSFRVRVPALSEDAGGSLNITNITDELGLTGLGSMIVIAVDSLGEVDAAASVDGFARVRSASSCSPGSVSQSLPAVTSQAFAAGRRARALGLRHDIAYRTNAGVVNLGETNREFTFVVDGDRRSERFTVSVPPFASLLTAIPDGNYGALALTVISDGAAAWAAYGSTVDNGSGDSWSAVAMPLP